MSLNDQTPKEHGGKIHDNNNKESPNYKNNNYN